MCGRKGKFGLNMQGACDAKGRFLDISIGYPGSTSDYLAFATSSLRTKLEKGVLALGLVICGDSACVSNEHVVTPFKSVPSGSEDACNFYQTQVRIRFECSFSM